MRTIWSLVSATLLSGCTTLSVDGFADQLDERTYMGIVRIQRTPQHGKSEAQINQLSATVVGARIDGGVSIGYVHESIVSVPLDCRLAVFIRGELQLRHAEQMFRAISKEKVCVAPILGE